MKGSLSKLLSTRAILGGTIAASILPFLILTLFPDQFHHIMDRALYLLFHNITEFFSIMVSLSIFGVGWYSYDQSRDRHVLFLSAAFLVIGLLDFMHVLANAAMPAFVTPNSSNKSTQFWIAARFFSALALFLSSFIYPETRPRALPGALSSKAVLMITGLALSAVIFTGVIFFPAYVPTTFVPGSGLTHFKVFAEYLITCLFLAAAVSYWRRMTRTGERQLIYYVAALVICIFSELIFAGYRNVFDTYNVVGHLYKLAAFSLIYKGVFIDSVENPYLILTQTNKRLDVEVAERRQVEEALREATVELEERVKERTANLEDAGMLLQIELSARRKAEEAYLSSEERFRTAVESTTDGFAIFSAVRDSEGKIVDFRYEFINESGARMNGRSREEHLGKTILQLLPAHLGTKLWQGYIRITEEGGTLAEESLLYEDTWGGERALRRAFDIRATGLGDGFVVLWRDVTDRYQAEEALKQSEARYHNLFANMTEEVHFWELVRDGEGKIRTWRLVDANPPALKTWGKNLEEIRDRTADEIFGPGATEHYMPVVERIMAEGKAYYFEDYFPNLDRYFRFTSIPLADHFITTGADITIHKQAEEGLRRARDDLEIRVQERTSELSEAFTRLEREMTERKRLEDQLRQAQKMEALGTLTGGIAHDFNNILASIIGFSEIALDDIPPETPLRRHIELILKSGFRARELIKQMLTFSRKTEYETKALPLSPLVKETAKLLRASIPTTVQIDVSCTALSDTVLANATGIQQVIMNLCTNAAYAMREQGGTLSIVLADCDAATDPLDAYVQLVVRDSGVGMDQEVIKRIFEPFFTTKEVGKGTGMGLAVVYGIVKSLKGNITVESAPGEGSTFRVLLPKAVDVAIPAAVPGTLPTGMEHILFLDDEELLTDLAKQILERLGYRVTVLGDSGRALELFSRDPSQFDLVITDQTMPGMTGLHLAEELLRIRAEIPIILCTGHSERVDREKARTAGIREFLMKPLARQELAEAVRRAIDTKQSG